MRPANVLSNPANAEQGAFRRALLVTFLLVGILYFIRFGYDFGVSDQDEFLPWLLHRLNPDLLDNDWFVGIQQSRWNVRSAFVFFLLPFATILPVWLAALVVYLLVFFLCTYALFHVTHRITASHAASALATVLILVLTPYWNLGGNEILNRMLVPSMLSWGIALLALGRMMSGKRAFAGSVLGVAAWFQPLVGLQVAAVFLPCIVFRAARDRETGKEKSRIREVLIFVAGFTVISAPVLLPIIVENLRSTGTPETAYIMTAFRNPHHYLPDTFPIASILRFLGLLLLGLGSLIFVKRAFPPADRRTLLALIASSLLLIIIAFVGTTMLHSVVLTKLQLFKISVLAKTVLLIGIAGAVLKMMPAGMVRWTESMLVHRWSGVTAGCVGALVITLAFVWAPLSNRALPMLERNASSEGEMVRWVRSNTASESIFAVPPSLTGFRQRAERAVFVNFKAFPFHESAMLEWYERLRVVAPIDPPRRGGVSALKALDESYHRRTAADLIQIFRSVGVTHFLFRYPMPHLNETDGLDLVFRNDGWWIYQNNRISAPAQESN